MELVELALRREILRELRDLLRAHALLGYLQHLECVQRYALADGDGVADLDGLGRLGGGAVELDFIAVAGLCGLAAGLVQADGPYVFVNSY